MTSRVHLGLDTATDRLSIAVRPPDGATEEEALEGARRHASALVPVVDRLVRRVGAAPDAIDLVAVAEGPGSFTGLRVGAAVAKAIAIAGGIPLWSAPSLLVRAAGIAAPGETVVAVASALRGELFIGAWEFHDDGSITARFGPRALPVTGLGVLPAAHRACGEGPPELLDAVARQVGAPVLGPPAAHPSAAVLLRLVGVSGGAVRVVAPARWEPVYGRPAEAQVQWELRHERPFPDPERHAG